MRRYILLLSILISLWTSVDAQQLWRTKRVELTGSLGTTMFFGDIGGFTPTENALGFKDLILTNTRFNVSGDITYRATRDVNVRLNLAYGMFHSSDEKGSNEQRALESTTSFFEQAIIGEYYFIKNRSEGSYLFNKRRGSGLKTFFESLDFYIFTGIGGIAYNVSGNDETRIKAENGFTAIIPVGVGVNMITTPEFNFGLELGGRYSFSDYLDGYTSQYSESNDVYYFLNVSFTYKLPTHVNGVPRFMK